MSVFLDDCSGDVDCVYFFDGGACAGLWHGSVLPIGGIPPKSLLYLFVNENAVPTIPLESVFALTPLISEGRFHIIKTTQNNSTPVLLGFYAGILHCHSSPEIRFTLVSKDVALDVVVDQLATQGRTVKRVPADTFSELFPTSPTSSSSPIPSSSRPPSASGIATNTFLPGILPYSNIHLTSPIATPSNISQLVIPSTVVIPPSPSPKNSTPLPGTSNVQSDADIINELAHTENFNKKTKKKIINRITNRKDLQISLINKLLETNNIERAAFICSQFSLHSLFPNLPPPLIPQPPPTPTSTLVKSSSTPVIPSTTTSSSSSTTTTTTTTTISTPLAAQRAHSPPSLSAAPSLPSTASLPLPHPSANGFLPPELNGFSDEDTPLPSQSTQTIQELQQMQIIRRQASTQPPLAVPDQNLKATPKKKAPAKVVKPGSTTPKKQAPESSPSIQSDKIDKNKQNEQTPLSISTKTNSEPKNLAYVPKTPKTPKAPPAPLSSTLSSSPSLSSYNLSSSNYPETPKQPIFTYKNAEAIKTIETRLLNRMYPVTHSEIRMQWDDPLSCALQCMAHMNITDKHDDPESRFLLQLLLSTLLDSGLTVAEMGRKGVLSFSVQENEAVIQETWKHLAHWEYSSDVLSTFKEIFMNGAEYNGLSGNERKQPQLTINELANEFGKGEIQADFVDHDNMSEDEHAWVEGWITRRIISTPNEEGQAFT